MGQLAYLLILVLDIVVIMDIIKNLKDNNKRIIWIVLVIFLPLLGPILYYFLGRK